MFRPTRRGGFTLLELILALSILSVLLVVISGALRITVRAWERGEGAVAAQQRSRTILDQLDRQLGSAVLLVGGREEAPLVAFTGTARSVEFTSSLPLAWRAAVAPVHVRYLVDAEADGRMRLLLYEKGVEAADRLNGRASIQDAEPLVLAEGLGDFRFEYLSEGDGADLQWITTWEPQTPTDWPRAVRITAMSAPGGHPVKAISRLHLWERPRGGS